MSLLGLSPIHPLGPHLLSHPMVSCTVTGAPLSLSPHPFLEAGDEEKPLWEQVQGFSLPHPTSCSCKPQITGAA